MDHLGVERDEPIVELADVEEFGKRGEKPPKARRYRIRIDKTYFEVDRSSMTGVEILALVGKSPVTHFLDEKLRGGVVERIEPAVSVDFTKKGVERFMTLPRTETEGTVPIHLNRRSFS
ncbi:MAG: multiubiquitin domain-containing protein [Gemmatimonadaceae bacterium]